MPHRKRHLPRAPLRRQKDRRDVSKRPPFRERPAWGVRGAQTYLFSYHTTAVWGTGSHNVGLIQSAKAPRQVSLAVFGRCVRPRAKQDFNTFTVPPARSHVQRLPRDVTRVHVHPRTQGCFVVLFPRRECCASQRGCSSSLMVKLWPANAAACSAVASSPSRAATSAPASSRVSATWVEEVCAARSVPEPFQFRSSFVVHLRFSWYKFKTEDFNN